MLIDWISTLWSFQCSGSSRWTAVSALANFFIILHFQSFVKNNFLIFLKSFSRAAFVWQLIYYTIFGRICQELFYLIKFMSCSFLRKLYYYTIFQNHCQGLFYPFLPDPAIDHIVIISHSIPAICQIILFFKGLY